MRLRYIIIAPAFLLIIWAGMAGCSSVHKLITKDKKTVDSSHSFVVDTSWANIEKVHTENLKAWGVDVGIIYGPQRDTPEAPLTPAEAALLVAKSKPADRIRPGSKVLSDPADQVDEHMRELLEDAISASGDAGNIASATIHFDSLTIESGKKVSVDTGSVHAKSTTQVKTGVEHSTKTVQKTSPVWIIYLAIGIGILLVFLVIIYKLKKL